MWGRWSVRAGGRGWGFGAWRALQTAPGGSTGLRQQFYNGNRKSKFEPKIDTLEPCTTLKLKFPNVSVYSFSMSEYNFFPLFHFNGGVCAQSHSSTSITRVSHLEYSNFDGPWLKKQLLLVPNSSAISVILSVPLMTLASLIILLFNLKLCCHSTLRLKSHFLVILLLTTKNGFIL